MKSISKLTKEFIEDLNNNSHEEHRLSLLSSRKGLVTFYRSQLRKFIELGIGKRTSNRVMISPQLINITIKRLKELKGGIL
tara:strand:+ start:10234 stop:10476 length:243 start_codon:yes stop_codon:yes gene_type:complete